MYEGGGCWLHGIRWYFKILVGFVAGLLAFVASAVLSFFLVRFLFVLLRVLRNDAKRNDRLIPTHLTVLSLSSILQPI